MTYQRQLRRIAGYQHGIITTIDADEADVPPVVLRKLAQRGVLRKIGHGVYRFIDFPTTTGSSEAEAVAIVGEDSYLEGESVLSLLELGHANPVRVEVATLRQVRRSLPRWLKVTRRTTLHEDQLTTYHGVPSVTLSTALQQVRNRTPEYRWKEAVDQATKRDLLSVHELDELLANRPHEAA